MNGILAKAAAAMAATSLLPLAVAKACIDANWRASLAERFGGAAWQGVDCSVCERVWFHGASVGEVGGMLPVVEQFKQIYPQTPLLISTTSGTGKSRAIDARAAEAVCLLPFDHPYFVRRAIARVNPRLVVISETELWPNLMFALHERRIPVVIINGRISDYSFPRYRRLRALISPVLRAVSRVLVQTGLDRERFIELGARAECVEVVGSTKYDRKVPELADAELASLAQSFGISRAKPVFVAGSVREAEDAAVIEAYCAAKTAVPGLQAIIAPRHPERFAETAQLLAAHNIDFNRRSMPCSEVKPVLLLDSLGELVQAYALASFVFVGATLVDIGGHNPLEPAAYSKPVIFGPYTGNVRDAVGALLERGGGFEVRAAPQLAQMIVRLCRDEQLCRQSGEAAQSVWRENIGATSRVIKELGHYLNDASEGSEI